MWSAVGYGYTTPPPPYDKDCAKASITKFLKRNSSSTGQAPSKSSLLVSPQRVTNPTGAHSKTSRYTLTSRKICPALLLNPASRWHAANLAPTLTIRTACPDIADLTQYVLHAFATKSPPYHVTTDDIAIPPIMINVAKITDHQSVRGRGGAIAVLYETHWDSLLPPHLGTGA